MENCCNMKKPVDIKKGDENKIYFCIDLKTFFASVECVERNLDPFVTNLVVCDSSRGKGGICLAITPAMKKLGIKNRCRIYEIPENVEYITAKPRMKKYMEYSAKVYSCYLKFIASSDIHPYSIDEMFLDVTNYLKTYKLSPQKLAKVILDEVFLQTGLTATCGIGPNLFLAKVALDISAKHSRDNIAYLNQDIFKKTLWTHTPLTDFWQIGNGIQKRLSKMGIHTMEQIAKCDQQILFKEFGINAKFLIDHANGLEPTTIEEIKSYRPQNESVSHSQILFEDYTFDKAKIVVTEMVDVLSLRLIENQKICGVVGLTIGYSKNQIEPTGASEKMEICTNVFSVLNEKILKIFEKTTKKDALIRKISIFFGKLQDEQHENNNLLFTKQQLEKERKVQRVVNNIKQKFGKNSIMRGTSLKQGATQKIRNKLIGGHNSGEED